VDLQFVHQAGFDVLLDDARAAGHGDVLVTGGYPSLLERRLDPVGDEGERRSSLLGHGLSSVVREDEYRHAEGRVISPPAFRVEVIFPGPSPPLNIRLPIRTAPVVLSDSSTTSASALIVPPDRPWRSRKVASPTIHSWSRSPPLPSGCSSVWVGPAMKPSSDIVMSKVSRVIAPPA
jgi:hypothetical protein